MIAQVLLELLAAVLHCESQLGRVCCNMFGKAPREELLSHLTDIPVVRMFCLDTQMVGQQDHK